MDVPTIFSNLTAYGFEADDVMTDDRKLEALNEVYADACSREDWPFLEASATIAYAGGSSTGTVATQPTNIGKVLAVIRAADGQRMEPWRLDDFYQTYGSALARSGNPLLYYFEGGQLKVYPAPLSTDTVLVKYIKVPTDLLATSTEATIIIPKQYHRSVLVVGTLARLAVMQDDIDMANAYERLYEKGLVMMASNLLEQQSDRPDFIHVNDPDNWDYS